MEGRVSSTRHYYFSRRGSQTCFSRAGVQENTNARTRIIAGDCGSDLNFGKRVSKALITSTEAFSECDSGETKENCAKYNWL